MSSACKKDDATTDRGAPPPPPASANPAKAGACAGGGGEVTDPPTAPFFSRTVATYCVDPQGETKSYGDRGKFSMDEVCTTAFDGECEVYKRFGLKRTVALRYVDGSGGDGSVDIYLSEFKDLPSGYGMFTKRVVADADPADPSAPRILAAGGAGAIGTGRAYVWKGPYLVELQYNNEQESPDKLAKSSEVVLSAIAKDIGGRLPGAPDVAVFPASAKALPATQRIPNGVSYVLKEPLGLTSVGQAAIGYYKDGDKRYRIVALARDDSEKAKDEFKAIRSRPGALPVTGLADEAAVMILQSGKDGPKLEYVFARKGPLVLGLGDEEFAAGAQSPTRLTKDEKVAQLRNLFESQLMATPAASAPGAAAKQKK